MDVFMEKIVSKKKDIKDHLIKVGILVAGGTAMLFVPMIPIIGSMAFIIDAGIIYLMYYLITSRNVEFEYIVTNGDLDIDKITSKRKRKRVFSAHCKEFDIVAKLNSDKYDNEARNIKNRLELVSTLQSPDVYFATLTYKGERTIVFFEPDERMLNSFKTFIPRKVFI